VCRNDLGPVTEVYIGLFRRRAFAEGLPNAEFLEINAVDHGDLSGSPEAIARIRRFCEEAAAASG